MIGSSFGPSDEMVDAATPPTFTSSARAVLFGSGARRAVIVSQVSIAVRCGVEAAVLRTRVLIFSPPVLCGPVQLPQLHGPPSTSTDRSPFPWCKPALRRRLYESVGRRGRRTFYQRPSAR